jgi:hypothetical protein
MLDGFLGSGISQEMNKFLFSAQCAFLGIWGGSSAVAYMYGSDVIHSYGRLGSMPHHCALLMITPGT